MTGMPFNLQAKKGVFKISEISSSSNPCAATATAGATSVSSFSSLLVVDNNHKWKRKSCYKEESIISGCCFEPTSVLDTRKSPSPPTSTSTSTLSSSLGAPSTTGSTDSAAGVAAVSDNPPSAKWPSTHGDSPSAAAAAAESAGGNSNRKDEWGSELQPIPTALEIIGGGEKCGGGGGGGGMEDWESMWPETAASPSQEQSLLRWIMGDVEDTSSGLKQFLQGVGPSDHHHHQFEGNAGFGILDSGSGSVSAALEPLTHPSLLAAPQLPNNVRPVASNSLPIPHHTAAAAALPLNLPLPISLSSTGFFQQPQQFELAEEKPQLLSPHHQQQILINQHQQQNQNNNDNNNNSAFFVHLPSFAQQDQQGLLPPQPKRHHPSVVDPSFQISKAPFTDSAQELYLRRQQQQQQQQQNQQGYPQQLQLLPSHLQQRPLIGTKAKLVGGPGEEVSHHRPYQHQFHQTQQTQQQQQQQTQQQQALIDQLFKAAELVESGNLVHARGILARLNHQLSPVGKPLHRAAFYFKEALLLLTATNNAAATATSPHRESPPPSTSSSKLAPTRPSPRLPRSSNSPISRVIRSFLRLSKGLTAFESSISTWGLVANGPPLCRRSH
ncbi:hypothetical protein Sjap_020345 [Stephania japonica]|uniref:Uncharacterized protein n=1 Tax=Stephania japonica TaxID=461633 RepID=A0AAP0F1V4_9MAGN